MVSQRAPGPLRYRLFVRHDLYAGPGLAAVACSTSAMRCPPPCGPNRTFAARARGPTRLRTSTKHDRLRRRLRVALAEQIDAVLFTCDAKYAAAAGPRRAIELIT